MNMTRKSILTATVAVLALTAATFSVSGAFAQGGGHRFHNVPSIDVDFDFDFDSDDDAGCFVLGLAVCVNDDDDDDDE
jgi:hypothetical protein